MALPATRAMDIERLAPRDNIPPLALIRIIVQ